MVFQTFGLGFILAAIYCARHMVLASGGHLVRGHAAHNRRRRGTAEKNRTARPWTDRSRTPSGVAPNANDSHSPLASHSGT